MSVPLRVLIVTDSYPPVCGGSGWSTWELVRGLGARGHHVEVVKVEAGRPSGTFEGVHEGVRVTTFRAGVPAVPVLRNVIQNERLWAKLTATVLGERLSRETVDVVHAQHVKSAVPSIRAGVAAGVPVVATVRDYWPVCYWSDLIFDPGASSLCPECSVAMMTKCVLPRAGVASVAAWSVIPYMRANLRTKRRTLARAGAIIAVSSTLAHDLETRAPEIARTPMFTIPNPVDMTALDEAALGAARPLAEPYVLYAGKLAINKGVQFLARAIADADIRWPVVVAGDGPLRGQLEHDARAAGLDLRVLGWRDRSEVLAWMRHAAILAFPSYGPESLSRVLIEAAALGAPIAAMDTGGTRDIIHAGVTGLLSSDPAAFARDLARLATDDRLRKALGAAARADVHQRFATASVAERVEQVYRGLLRPLAA
ncbi:MAG TPA: glycosyltransferase family 4 protein [Vicinamibacterales bacterium]|nr:glycosyltransferase family 4 protein [Vicinamibacterales bacterium]